MGGFKNFNIDSMGIIVTLLFYPFLFAFSQHKSSEQKVHRFFMMSEHDNNVIA